MITFEDILDPIKHEIEISPSMDIEVHFFCKDHNCTLSELVEALLLFFLWHNNKLLKILIERKSEDDQ